MRGENIVFLDTFNHSSLNTWMLGILLIGTFIIFLYWIITTGIKLRRLYINHKKRLLEKRIATAYCLLLDEGEWMSSSRIKRYAEQRLNEKISHEMHEKILFLLTENNSIKKRLNKEKKEEECKIIC